MECHRASPARRGPGPGRWPVVLAGLCVVAGLAGVGTITCLVHPVCTDDAACPPPLVCQDQACVFVCETDADCNQGDICESYRCMPDLECLACDFPHAVTSCHRGDCRIEHCETGYQDLNSALEDGCEYACTPTGPETCNGKDDDCDGAVDEDFDLLADPSHCGGCDAVCPDAPAHAQAVCANGSCRYQCDAGWYDLDGDLDAALNGERSNGCEADVCQETFGGEEACDMQDNDCDGEIDEGVVKDTVEHCGAFCTDCTGVYPNATATCDAGRCEMSGCLPGYWNNDRDVTNGCEYACEYEGEEVCDDRDNDCDGAVDEGLLCCPDDMVPVEGAFCIDRYEASRPDATAAWAGADDSGPARSVPGVLPWQVGENNALAEAACERAGKRLCTAVEWELACRGPDQTRYSYGDEYEPLTCNGIDAHCQAEPAYAGCGLDEYDFQLEPTGSYPGCTNEYGVMDINGNVWEHVAGGDGTMVRGGAYNCADSEKLHDCGYIPGDWTPAALGFRCCLDP